MDTNEFTIKWSGSRGESKHCLEDVLNYGQDKGVVSLEDAITKVTVFSVPCRVMSMSMFT